MATSVTARFELKAYVTSTSDRDLESAVSTVNQTFVNALVNGNATINKADQAFSDRRTLNAATSEDIDLFDFSSVLDAVGNPLTLAKVKAILIYNRSIVASDKLKIGGKGTSAAFTSIFDGSNAAKVVLGPDGIFFISDPSAAALAVADTTNHLLKIENPGANAITYDVIVLGSLA